jgi:hypothetical protein
LVGNEDVTLAAYNIGFAAGLAGRRQLAFFIAIVLLFRLDKAPGILLLS